MIDQFTLKALGLSEDKFKLIEYYYDAESKTHVATIMCIDYKPKCECGSSHCTLHSYRPKSINHCQFTMEKCNLIYKQRRFICKECGSTFLEPNFVSIGASRQSDKTVEFILSLLKQNISFSDIAARANVSSQTVIDYLDKYIDCKRKPLPEILCIDEFKNLSYGKGKYACLLINYQNGEIVDVLPNRRLDYLQAYFNKVSDEEKANVKFLVSDMYDGYKHLHDYVFNQSTFVIDGFHYIRYITEAFNDIRIRVMKSFHKKSSEYKLLKRYHRLLSKDSRKITNETKKWPYTDKEMSTHEFIDYIKSFSLDLSTAYNIKEEYLSSYRKVPFEEADKFLSFFITKLKGSLIPELEEVATTFKNWKKYIVNSFNRDEYGKRMSNGKIEGTNTRIKSIKRVSFGYDNFYHFRNRLMYIINEEERPLPFPKSTKNIEKEQELYIHKRTSYTKGFIHSKDSKTNAYLLKHLDYPGVPLMTDKEAISYLKSLHITKEELSLLNSWIKENNSFYTNPNNEVNADGIVINYIEFLRKN